MSEQSKTSAPGNDSSDGHLKEIIERDAEPAVYGDVAAAATAFAELKLQEGVHKKQLEFAKKKIDELEPQLLALFEKSGTANIKLQNGMTIYVRRQIWGGVADGVTKDDLIEKLKGVRDFSRRLPKGFDVENLVAWAKAMIGGEEEITIIARVGKEADTRFLIKEGFNAQTLAAWVRELEQDDEGEVIIPDELKGFLKATERISAAARKS